MLLLPTCEKLALNFFYLKFELLHQSVPSLLRLQQGLLIAEQIAFDSPDLDAYDVDLNC